MIRGALSTLTVFACVSSAGACAAECVALKAQTLSDVYAQLGPVRDQAYIEYFLGQPGEGVEGLTKLIEFYSRSQCTDAVPEEVRHVFQRNELLERGRLVRVHQRAGNAAKASAETTKAVKLGQAVFQNAGWSVADLLAIVAKADPSMETEVRAVMSGRDIKPRN